jgi:hypothetical protein
MMTLPGSVANAAKPSRCALQGTSGNKGFDVHLFVYNTFFWNKFVMGETMNIKENQLALQINTKTSCHS